MVSRRVPFGAAVLVVAVAVLLAAGAADASRGKSKSKSLLLAYSFLAPHNAARGAVRVPPLAWDERLARRARQYAAARRADCALVHSHSHSRYGENLFWGSGAAGGWTPADVVGAWVKERALYDPATNTCRGGRERCGHYTQIVWRGTTAVGCALVSCAGGRGTFGVCVYNPPGNYVGMRPY